MGQWGISIIGIIGSLGLFVYAGGYMLGIIHEFDVIYVWGFKWGVSVHSRLGIFSGTSVYQGIISKS